MMNPRTNIDTEETITLMLNDAGIRKSVTQKSFYWFFMLYFARYLTVEMADFQKEIIKTLEDDSKRRITIVAFRGSGKSTIVTLAFALWAIMGREQRKCVLIAAESQEQVRRLIDDIKANLETNELLARDLGPFREDGKGEWRNTSLFVENFGALIKGVYVGQSIRGIKNREYRPDMLIGDDMEDLDAVRTLDARNKTAQWIRGEFFAARSKNARTVIVGNYLHEDSFTQRLRQGIPETCTDEVYLHHPLLDEKGSCLWPAMYPDEQSLEKLRRDIDDDATWYREYLLRIIPDSERVIHLDWITYYDTPPPFNHPDVQLIAMGVDVAYSDKDRADKTAIVCALAVGYGKDMRIYILPIIVNEKLLPLAVEQTTRDVANSFKGKQDDLMIFVEDVTGQRFFIDRLKADEYYAKGVPVHGSDKRTRLMANAHLVQSGQVLFPRTGAKELIDQLVNFGVERYDDLADAYSLVMNGVMANIEDSRPVGLIRCGPPSRLRDRMNSYLSVY